MTEKASKEGKVEEKPSSQNKEETKAKKEGSSLPFSSKGSEPHQVVIPI